VDVPVGIPEPRDTRSAAFVNVAVPLQLWQIVEPEGKSLRLERFNNALEIIADQPRHRGRFVRSENFAVGDASFPCVCPHPLQR
jgi:hypothetical protein